jgi:hypothetical protein
MKYKWGDDGSKRRKSETKPGVRHTGGFRRTQLRGKMLLVLGYCEYYNSHGDRKRTTADTAAMPCYSNKGLCGANVDCARRLAVPVTKGGGGCVGVYVKCLSGRGYSEALRRSSFPIMGGR